MGSPDTKEAILKGIMDSPERWAQAYMDGIEALDNVVRVNKQLILNAQRLEFMLRWERGEFVNMGNLH